MPRKAPEISILDMSVARSSASETTVESSIREVQATPDRSKSTTGKATRRRRQKENDVEELVEFTKLKGRQRIAASEALDKVIQGLPSLTDIKEEAIKTYKDKIESIDRILEILGDDASRVPLDALGDFTVLALDPKPFAVALEEAAKEYEMRSPEPSESKQMKETIRSKLKTSTSLTRVNSCVTPSGKKPSTSIAASKAAPRVRNEPTPLRNRGR
ncbi:uncharacterized protein LOC100909199 [Galendromus occidentalis]|uniref:Uncharacterized protein LOC100909199 n=1 Tax=Galendromus occidentalis TaxID=34638 RepID=A0AAJ6QNV6_9ACAR|nr:uncharacterized protein LOC100909199 [Galendromus occidentalis]